MLMSHIFSPRRSSSLGMQLKALPQLPGPPFVSIYNGRRFSSQTSQTTPGTGTRPLTPTQLQTTAVYRPLGGVLLRTVAYLGESKYSVRLDGHAVLSHTAQRRVAGTCDLDRSELTPSISISYPPRHSHLHNGLASRLLCSPQAYLHTCIHHQRFCALVCASASSAAS
jgi:hypothetical protein